MKLPAAGSIILSAGVIILLLATAGHWSIVFIAGLLALIWLVGLNRRWTWSYDVGFLTLLAAAAWGVNRQIGQVWMLVAVVLALVGWDLSRFLNRLAATAQGEQLYLIQIGHIRYLVPVLIAIIAVSALGLTVHIQLNLGQSILLGLALGLSLAWLMKTVQRGGSS